MDVKMNVETETVDDGLGINKDRAEEILDMVYRSIKNTATEETIVYRGNASASIKVISENVDTIEELVLASFALGKSMGIMMMETQRVIKLAQKIAELEDL